MVVAGRSDRRMSGPATFSAVKKFACPNTCTGRGREQSDARGFRALMLLQEEIALHARRLLVLDPPRTLRIICARLGKRYGTPADERQKRGQ